MRNNKSDFFDNMKKILEEGQREQEEKIKKMQEKKDRLDAIFDHMYESSTKLAIQQKFSKILFDHGYSMIELNISNDKKCVEINFNKLSNISFIKYERQNTTLDSMCSEYRFKDIVECLHILQDTQNKNAHNQFIEFLKNDNKVDIKYDCSIDEDIYKLNIYFYEQLSEDMELFSDIIKPEIYSVTIHYTLNKCTFDNYWGNNDRMSEESYDNNNFDLMDGYQFEEFCAQLLKNKGFDNVTLTQSSGDQGVDIIAYRDYVKYGFQCKCYSSTIGNKAVQEVFAGKSFYNCHVGVVITNNYFTKSAIELAQQNGIVLWDRDKLLKMI